MGSNARKEASMLREQNGSSVRAPVHFGEPGKGVFSLEEVAKHASREDCWVVIHGRVYDCSRFVASHPGGWLPIKALAGRPDASDQFEAFHPASIHETMLPSLCIGVVAADDCAKFAAGENAVDVACRGVRQELLRRNLFETSSSYYWKKMAWFLALFVGAISLTLAGGRGQGEGDEAFSWTCAMGGACLMGLFWQQVAFVGHDIGHNSVFHERINDLYFGILLGNPLMGISLGWWKQSHNVHHVVCNSVEHDPDIQHLPVFAVHEKIFSQGGFVSTYHKKRFDMDMFARLLVSFQHVLFYPVMALARFNLYAQSWINIIVQPHGRVPYRRLEIATLSAFVVWIALLVSTLPTWRERVAWLLTSHIVSGLLHVQICVSHFAMDLHREGDLGRAQGWYSLQLQTTMNVATPAALDWVHGGLQFQVEHHMFPRLPRHSLREARRLVRESLQACGALDAAYHEYGFVDANVKMIRAMRAVAVEASRLTKGDGGFYVSPLYEGLNLEG